MGVKTGDPRQCCTDTRAKCPRRTEEGVFGHFSPLEEKKYARSLEAWVGFCWQMWADTPSQRNTRAKAPKSENTGHEEIASRRWPWATRGERQRGGQVWRTLNIKNILAVLEKSTGVAVGTTRTSLSFCLLRLTDGSDEFL